MTNNWKQYIIGCSEYPEAKDAKIDATFFPAVSDAELSQWEASHEIELPTMLQEFFTQSNGMEARRGIWTPVKALEHCDLLRLDCQSQHPFLRFGQSEEYEYFLRISDSPSVFRTKRFGGEEEFYCRNLREYFHYVFRNRF